MTLAGKPLLLPRRSCFAKELLLQLKQCISKSLPPSGPALWLTCLTASGRQEVEVSRGISLEG